MCGTHIYLPLPPSTYLYPHLSTLIYQSLSNSQAQRKLRFPLPHGTLAYEPAPFSPTAPRSISLLYVHYNDKRIRITYTYIIRLLPVYYTSTIHLLYIYYIPLALTLTLTSIPYSYPSPYPFTYPLPLFLIVIFFVSSNLPLPLASSVVLLVKLSVTIDVDCGRGLELRVLRWVLGRSALRAPRTLVFLSRALLCLSSFALKKSFAPLRKPALHLPTKK